MLFITGLENDDHVARTCEELAGRSDDFLVRDYTKGAALSIDVGASGTAAVRFEGRTFSPDDVIWNRAKFFPGTPLYFQDTQGKENEFDRHRRHSVREMEWKSAFLLLGALYPEQFINSPVAKWRMSKPHQQVVAAGLGFATPASLVTSSRSEAITFAERQGSMIVKSLAGQRVRFKEQSGVEDKVIMTMSCEPAEVRDAADTDIAAAPHFFQKRIIKDHEVRVFAHRGACFAFQINSQSYPYTQVDWRYGSGYLDFQPCDTPPAIMERIDRFLEAFGLFYGSFDFIVDPQGAWWFIECNEDGQWGWLDEKVDGAMTRSFAQAVYDRFINSTKVDL
ncbi:hypothetical protein ACWCOP_04690 [Maricaulaceae bacterium MS644]